MSLDVEAIDDGVVGDIARNMGLKHAGELFDSPRHLNQVKNMSVEEALDKFLRWNGIIGWTGMILNAVDSLRAAQTDDEGAA